MWQKLLTYSSFILLLASCQGTSTTTSTESYPQGKYRAAIQLQGNEVPFFIQFEGEGANLKAYILNSDERLETDVLIKEDSIIMDINVFDASLRAKYTDTILTGEWVKHYVKNYRAPFKAALINGQQRFKLEGNPAYNFTGKWETYFSLGSGEPRPAVGNFRQEGNHISGSFALASGDFRYLEGNVSDSTFYLSTFNGEEAKLFIGQLNDSGELIGKYLNGLTGNYSFTAKPNENFRLASKDRKVSTQTINFSFPDLQGNIVSLSDPQFMGKPLIVQIFGSWCPSCMDETKYLGQWYNDNKERIEIVALAFEKKDDFQYAKARVEKSKNKLKADYTFLIAGHEKDASKVFPTIDGPIYFPTTLYIDKKGLLRKVHSGFNGPSTGPLFEQWKADHQAIVEELVKE
ncbi:peroxiredoxin family protein [Pontibacter rugosus]|uniref:Peroxiredoxin family protein n=1 Tax=Pontibacter rugosus TaxID=1745966 RepID=A0ABW3SWN2_9BACT